MKVRARPSTKIAIFVLILASACSLGGGERHWNLAANFEQSGQFMKAIEEYSRIVNLGSKTPLAIKAQLQIAAIYERNLRDPIRAIRAYRDVYRRSDDPRIRLRARKEIASIYSEKMMNPGSAAQEYGEIYSQENSALGKDGPDVLLAWGTALSEAGRYEEATDKFQKFRKEYPGHVKTLRTYIDEGHARLAERKPELAADCFRQVISSASVETQNNLVAEAFYGLGMSLEMNDELPEALESYKRSLSIYPNPDVVKLKILSLEKRKKDRKY